MFNKSCQMNKTKKITILNSYSLYLNTIIKMNVN